MRVFSKKNIQHDFGIFFNIIIIIAGWVYFLFLRSFLLDTSVAIHEETTAVPWVGLIVIVAMVIENFGVFYKISQLENISSRRFLVNLLIVAHGFMDSYLVVFILRSFGFPSPDSSLWLIIIVLVVVKQSIMFIHFNVTAKKINNGKKDPPRKLIPSWIVNIMLALAAVVIIIVLWESLFVIAKNPLDELGREATIVHLLGTMLFMMLSSLLILLPVRLGFIVDDMSMKKKAGCLTLSLSLVFTAFLSILPAMFR